MKVCCSCSIEKPFTDFFFKSKKHNKLHSICKECKRIKDSNHYRLSEDRRVKMRINALAASDRVRAFLRRYKRLLKCSNCGDSRYYVLDFHHIDDKAYNISKMASRGVSMGVLKKELRKCIPLCSNCHRELHYMKSNACVI